MTPQTSPVTRRAVLRAGFLGGVGLSLADYLALTASPQGKLKATADSVIFIHLQGGPSHLDTLDMKPEGPAEERGEFKPIKSKLTGLVVCELLPKLASVIDRYTLVRGISHSSGAHPQANQYLFTGNAPSPAVTYPALGSVAIKERPTPSDLPGFVAIPSSDMNAGYLGVAYSPFKTGSVPKPGQPFEVRGLALPQGLTVEKVKQREELLRDLDTVFRKVENSSEVLEGMDRFGRQAQEMLLSPRAREAFDTAKEPRSIATLFDGSDFNQSLLLAVRLVEQGVRFVSVNSDGWDTHLDNFKALRSKLLPPFDSGLAALVEALRQKGLLEKTLVVVSGEFGRTPTINKNAGRDHWPRAMWALFTGGGVRQGQLIGATDSKGHGPASGTNLKLDDLAASVYRALGINHQMEYVTRTARPVYLVPGGKVIPGLYHG